MAGFVVAGWIAGARDVSGWISLAALLYLTGAYPSVKLWDYLVDPIAAIASLIIAGVRIWRRNAQPRANRENAFTTRS